MQKTLTILFALLIALPSMAMADQNIASAGVAKSSMIIAPQISQEKAESIVKSWGATVTSSQLNYNTGFATWDVYGYYVTTLGPSKIKLNILARLDANSGEFVSLEIKKQGMYDKNLVYEKMNELGVSVQSMNLINGMNPYWEIYGTKYIDLGGYGFDMNLYIRVDAKTGNILEVSQQPLYSIMGTTQPVNQRAIPYIGTTLAESQFPIMGMGAKPISNIVVDKFPTQQIVVDDAIEVE